MLKDEKKRNLIFLVWIIILAIGFVRKEFQNDTFYTIKVGESILKNGVDMLDHFSIHANLPYVYPHWLYDVFIYLIYRYFGFFGIYISSIILFIFLIIIVFFISKHITKNANVSYLSTFLFANAMGTFVCARAQLLSYILFALEFIFIELFLEKKKNKFLFFLVLISLILCNVHSAVWLFYFVIYLPYIAEWIASNFLNKKDIFKLKNKLIFSDFKGIKKLLIVIIISLLMGFIVPNGLNSFTHLIKLSMGNSQSYISEHQKPSLTMIIFPIIIYAQIIFFAFKSKIKLSDFFMVSGLTLMSLISARHISLFCLLGLICYSRSFNIFIKQVKFNEQKLIPKKKKRFTVVCFIICIFTTSVKLYYNSQTNYISEKEYPIEATNYIKNNIDISKIRLFNGYDFGSYLLFNNIPVFIDSRCDLYTSQFNKLDYDILEDYMHMSSNYKEKFKFYNISHVLIEKKTKLYKKLVSDKDFVVLHEDKYFCFLERVGGSDEK